MFLNLVAKANVPQDPEISLFSSRLQSISCMTTDRSSFFPVLNFLFRNDNMPNANSMY
jgi:hypothetical protein